MLYAQIAALIANASLNWIFILKGLKYGLKWAVFGAGLASLLVDVIIHLVKLLAAWKFIKSRKNFFDVLKSALGTAIIFTLLYFTCHKIENNWTKIGLSMILGALVYALAEILLRHPTAKMFTDILLGRLKKIWR